MAEMRVVAERPEPVQAAVSVVVTLYDEAATVDELYRRVVQTLDAAGEPWELILVDDGSADGTWAAVERLHEADARVRGVRFRRNAGQHPAMHAGLSRARGDIVVTMDGDLQNPPEEIPKLVAAVEAGSDVASGRRVGREDSAGRTVPSRVINGLLRRLTGVPISDFGCAFNAYRRETLEPLLGAIGRQKFTKALVVASGATVVEVDVDHAARDGASKYSPLRLLRLALHVVVGFWPQPIQWLGVALGVVCAVVATALGIYAAVYWVGQSNFPGPLLLGVLVLYVLAMQGFVLALVGEYLSRIQRDVEGRPLYIVEKEL
jgi:undecaprenyl-phosphate 4-deoxy-4-formamido-L-arabinose transferase